MDACEKERMRHSTTRLQKIQHVNTLMLQEGTSRETDMGRLRWVGSWKLCIFCQRALQKRRYSAKETYDLKEPTNRSHPTDEASGQSIFLFLRKWPITNANKMFAQLDSHMLTRYKSQGMYSKRGKVSEWFVFKERGRQRAGQRRVPSITKEGVLRKGSSCARLLKIECFAKWGGHDSCTPSKIRSLLCKKDLAFYRYLTHRWHPCHSCLREHILYDSLSVAS